MRPGKRAMAAATSSSQQQLCIVGRTGCEGRGIHGAPAAGLIRGIGAEIFAILERVEGEQGAYRSDEVVCRALGGRLAGDAFSMASSCRINIVLVGDGRHNDHHTVSSPIPSHPATSPNSDPLDYHLPSTTYLHSPCL